MMEKRKPISAKIRENVHKQATIVAKKNNMSFSRYIEIALIHEMNGENRDNGILAELEDIKQIVQMKIDNLSIVTEEPSDFRDEQWYINDLRRVNDAVGHVDLKMVENYATECGMTMAELIQKIYSMGIYLNYVGEE